jgi:hypothetical protein
MLLSGAWFGWVAGTVETSPPSAWRHVPGMPGAEAAQGQPGSRSPLPSSSIRSKIFDGNGGIPSLL